MQILRGTMFLFLVLIYCHDLLHYSCLELKLQIKTRGKQTLGLPITGVPPLPR